MDPDHAKDLGDVVELKGVSLKRALFSAGQHLKKASAWDGSKAIVCIQRHRKKGDWLDRAGAPPPEDL